MKPRERVLKALDHKEPDRVPLDSAFRPEIWRKLREYFNVSKNEDVMRKLGIDLRTVTILPPEEFMKKTIPKPQFEGFRFVRRISQNVFEDEWGIKYEIGSTGLYWHFVYHPLQDAESINDYEMPNVDAVGRFDLAEREVKQWVNEYAVAGGGDIEETLFEQAWYLRGYRQFIKDLYTNPTFVNQLLDKLLKYRVEQGKRLIEIGVDIVRLGDDLGAQTGMMIPLTIWRRYFKPRMRRLIRELRKGSNVYIFYHSDGNIKPLIPELIEIGVDILNPVQPECMDPAEIKETYKDKLTLHGTISIQETLPHGTVKDVEREVLTRVKTCGKSGGLIIAPSHVVQPDTPLENVLAVYETAKAYSR